MAIREVQRVDALYQISPAKRSREGYINTTGTLAAPGIFIYLQGDKEIRELVPREVLRETVYCDQFAGRPLIDEHPEDLHLALEDVGNKRPLCGSTGAAFYSESDDEQQVPIYLTTKHGVELVESGKVWLSPAYRAKIDDTPGTDPEFGPYDTKQVWRGDVNHTAITSDPRGGPRMAIKIDSKKGPLGIQQRADSTGPAPAPAPNAEQPPAWAAKILETLAGIASAMQQLAQQKADAGEENKPTPTPAPPGEEIKADAKTINALAQERLEIMQLAQAAGVEIDTTADNAALKRTLLSRRYPEEVRADSKAAEVDVLWRVFKREQAASPTPEHWQSVGAALHTSRIARADSQRKAATSAKPIDFGELEGD